MQYICMYIKVLFALAPWYSPDCQPGSVLTQTFCSRILKVAATEESQAVCELELWSKMDLKIQTGLRSVCLTPFIYPKMTRDGRKKHAISQVLTVTVKNLHKEEASRLTNEYRPSPKRWSIRSLYLSISSGEHSDWSPQFLHDIPTQGTKAHILRELAQNGEVNTAENFRNTDSIATVEKKLGGEGEWREKQKAQCLTLTEGEKISQK